MDKESGFYKLSDIVRTDTSPGIIPVSASRWYAGIKSGEFPAGHRLGGITVWRKEDINSLIEKIVAGALDTSERPPIKNRALMALEREELELLRKERELLKQAS